MFLGQNPLRNILLQLVAGWPTFDDKRPGLTSFPQQSCSSRLDWESRLKVMDRRGTLLEKS